MQTQLSGGRRRTDEGRAPAARGRWRGPRAMAMLAVATGLCAAATPVRAAHVGDWNGDGTVVIGCLGDSNTFSVAGIPSWCAKLGALVADRGWQVQSYGTPGATVHDPNPLAPGFVSTATQQLQTALAGPLPPDLFILAFGTNDVGGGLAVPAIVDAYAAVQAAIEATGRRALVALTPPVCATRMVNGMPANDINTALNAALGAAFPGADDLIDLGTILDLATDYRDCVHMNDAGMTKRADQAFADLTAPPFEHVYPGRTHTVCHIPRSGNAQRVLGFDTGFSFVHNGVAYWSAGDSLIDGNGNGVIDDPWGFRTGSIGRSVDLDASNCVDVPLRTTTGSDVLPVLTPDRANGECLIWPGRVFEANGRLYFFYNSVQRLPDCAAGRPTTYAVGLGELTDPDSGDLAPVRVGTGLMWPTGENPYPSAVKAGGRIYLFDSHADRTLKLARVPEERIANRNRYQYWNGSAWIEDDPTVAVPVADNVDGPPSVAYNAYIDRYMMVYTCGWLASGVCARTAVESGPQQTALFSGWNAPTLILPTCAAPTCGHAFWHSGYTDPEHPERIFISTAHWPGRDYFITLHAVDLSGEPTPSTRTFANGEADFSSQQGFKNWTYVSYKKTVPGADIIPLSTWSPSTPVAPPYPSWAGDEDVDGVRAPGVFRHGAYPSATRGAARVWTAPAAGTVEISGEAWLESTQGDGAIADILVARAGSTTTLWSKHLPVAWDDPQRARRLAHIENVEVAAGDRILFGVRAGNQVDSTATKDLTYFLASVVYDRTAP